MYQALLIHLSNNISTDLPADEYIPPSQTSLMELLPWTWEERLPLYGRRSRIQGLDCDDAAWRRSVDRFAASGGNLLVIDVGDGVEFSSHPEIAVSGAWSREKLAAEVRRCRELGLEVVPKLNFSAAHDAWLREYGRMVSTPAYYRVCGDLIREVAEIFDGPRYFHLGMDEENAGMQTQLTMAVIRQGELWWHDLNFFCDAVRGCGARPWMWSDKLWYTTDEEYSRHVSRDVVQSNWYYRHVFEVAPAADDSARTTFLKKCLETFLRLDRLGYEQIPCGSNWAYKPNMKKLVAFCREHCSERVLGFMTAPWVATVPEGETLIAESCELLADAMK